MASAGSVALYARDHGYCARLSDGTISCFGAGYYGQNGNGTTSNTATPVPVIMNPSAPQATAVMPMGNAFCYTSAAGTFCTGNWVRDASGYPTSQTTPQQIGWNIGESFAGGYATGCYIQSGQVFCWGENSEYQGGNGSTNYRYTPVAVSGISTARSIFGGPQSTFHFCAILTDGTSRCWGRNTNGQLGAGNTTTYTTPVSVTAASNVVKFAIGQRSTCALNSSGQVRCWGGNAFGQLGDGTTTDQLSGVTLTSLGSSVIDIVAAGTGFCAVKSDKTVWCWGSIHGVVNSLTPQNISWLNNAVQIAAGYSSVCGLFPNGEVRCHGLVDNMGFNHNNVVQFETRCTLPWGGTISNGQSVTAYQNSSVPFGSSCVSQVRTCNNGSLSGSYQYSSCAVQPPANCSATTLSWGTSNFCQSSVPASNHGASVSLTNGTVGASGSATASCFNGSWSLSGSTCSANLALPSSVAATDGSLSGQINVTWGAVAGASGYDIQYRKQGDTSWSTASTSSTSWTLTTSNESVYEFRVRAKNAVGSGNWSATETGYIRPAIDPVFVSQTVPSDVKAGSTFAVRQNWLNKGALTWTNALDLGIQPGTAGFSSPLAKVGASTNTGQTGVFTASVTAPNTPGSYNLAMNWRYNGTTYASSPAAQVRVWGDPACSSVTASKTMTYSTSDRITITASVNSETTSATAARAWTLIGGQDDLRTYPITGSGPYQFEVNLAQHSGFGMVRAEIDLANPVAAGTCFVEFELRQVTAPTVSLQPIYGGDGGTRFVIRAAGGPTLSVSARRTDDLPLQVDLLNEQGAAVSSQTLTGAAGRADLSATPWTGPAWEARAYSVRVRYHDDGAHAQVGALTLPVEMLIAPQGASLQAQSSTSRPLTITSAVRGPADSAWSAGLGEWDGKLDLVSPARELEGFGRMEGGSRTFGGLSYEQLWDKTLRVTARAVPPAGITLETPIELTATVQPALMGVRNVQATDGTLEEDVRITWEAPVDGMTGVVYDVLRDGQPLRSGLTVQELLDRPPSREATYVYTVVARRAGQQSLPEEDSGYLMRCFAPRVESVEVAGVLQNDLSVLLRWLPCAADASLFHGFDGQPTSSYTQAAPVVGSEYRGAMLDISALGNGTHEVRLRSVGAVGQREQSFSFNINRSAILPSSVTILHNGAPAADGLTTNSIGRFGIRLEGGAADTATFKDPGN